MSTSSNNAYSRCHVMAKPSSSVCNLDCTYCFYLEKENLYPERKKDWRMSDETLEQYIKQTIEAQDSSNVEFSWQGGEPTLLGLDFFKRAVALQKKYGAGRQISNAFQTNALLIDKAWCQFFKENQFLLGISIDGPEELHDNFRVNRAKRPSHAKVMAAIELLKAYKVDFNTLTVVNSENIKHPEAVYEFLKSIGSTYMQFIPIVERKAATYQENGLQLVSPDFNHEAHVTEWSAPSRAFGEFLNRIFDLWIKKDVGRIFVNYFDNTLSTWCKEPANLCTFSETCGHAFILEANGDLYNCDHFVYPEYLIGNIHDTSIRTLNKEQKVTQFGLDKKEKLTDQCKHCPFLFACNGGCPKHRFLVSDTGQPGHNYFCEGVNTYFTHTAPYMQMMRDLLLSGRPASDIMMQLYQQAYSFRQHVVGRNEPCPCGSGKKSKKCCY